MCECVSVCACVSEYRVCACVGVCVCVHVKWSQVPILKAHETTRKCITCEIIQTCTGHLHDRDEIHKPSYITCCQSDLYYS